MYLACEGELGALLHVHVPNVDPPRRLARRVVVLCVGGGEELRVLGGEGEFYTHRRRAFRPSKRCRKRAYEPNVANPDVLATAT
jgi:hypothetical protein